MKMVREMEELLKMGKFCFFEKSQVRTMEGGKKKRRNLEVGGLFKGCRGDAETRQLLQLVTN